MSETDHKPALRRGWTTGACATAAVRAALVSLWSDERPTNVTIRLPRGETPVFAIEQLDVGDVWARASVIKDAGDDPDVTHGATIVAEVREGRQGITFRAGEGVGTVTKAGLPIAVGEPAINPVPREMMINEVIAAAAEFGREADIEITVSIPGGQEIAQRTWNPRLGIVGGLSILGTTGIVRPFSCAAWIASIHRGIDVARAAGSVHVAGCTGSTSETAVQNRFGLSDSDMLDMGDFIGGMLKYLRKNPIETVTIGGGIGKMTKLAQGAVDLHSARSQVDFGALALEFGRAEIAECNTMLEAFELVGTPLADWIATRALAQVNERFGHKDMRYRVVIVSRSGEIVTQCQG